MVRTEGGESLSREGNFLESASEFQLASALHLRSTFQSSKVSRDQDQVEVDLGSQGLPQESFIRSHIEILPNPS